MKIEHEVVFRCDECRKNITNKRHVRILMGWTSGWMVPPFQAGKPAVSLVERNPEHHFCKPECMASFFTKKLYAIGTDTRVNAGKVGGKAPAVPSPISVERPRVQWPHNMGARDIVGGEEGERAVGDSVLVREGSLGRRVAGSRDHGQAHQRVDRIVADQELGRSGSEVSASAVEAEAVVPHFIVRAFAATKKAAFALIP